MGVVFRYSWIYDKILSEILEAKMLPKKKINVFMRKLENEWRDYEAKVLKEMEKLTGFKWREKEIICYIVSNGICFSDPLTLRVVDDIDVALGLLLHELIHRLFSQSRQRWKKLMRKLKELFPEEDERTRNHILLYIVYRHICRKFFGAKFLRKTLRSQQRYYKKAIELSKSLNMESI